MSSFKLVRSTELKDYRTILEGLVDDFGYIYYHAILSWCNVIDKKDPELYWQVRLIKKGRKVIGICGLYSIKRNCTKELWLGWFGVLKEYRNGGIGAEVLQALEVMANKAGAKAVMSYVDSKSKALNFYKRNGYKVVSRVGKYVDRTRVPMDHFEKRTDFVIKKIL